MEEKTAAYQNRKEEAMEEFRENCWEHIPDACEISPPSGALDPFHAQTKQNDEIRR